MSSVDEIMTSLLNSPAKTKAQNGVVKVKYTATKKAEVKSVQSRQGRSQTRTPSVAPTPRKESLASQIMASRTSAPPVPARASGANSPVPETKGKSSGRGNTFSEFQKKRMNEELDKIPEMTAHFKRKVASQLSKEIGLNERQIVSWLTVNQSRKKTTLDSKKSDNNISAVSVIQPPKNNTASEKEGYLKIKDAKLGTTLDIKKEAPDSVLASKVDKPQFKTSDDIVCIDIDDDDELLVDSALNESVTLVESQFQPVPQKKMGVDKSKANQEESSKDEILHLLMDQIKELEKFVQTNSSPELEKFKKQMKEKVFEIEHLKKDVQTKETLARNSEQQVERFAQEVKSLKEEVGELQSNKSTSATDSTKALKVFKERVSELEKLVKNKDEDHYILKNKLDLVEKVASNKVQMYKEKLEEVEKSKSSGDFELKKKYDSLQKDFSEKVEVVKSLESRIPKMIEEFTKYVEEKDSLHIIKEKEYAIAMSEKHNEISEANRTHAKISKEVVSLKQREKGALESLAGKTKEVKVLEQREKETLEKKQVEFIKSLEQKEKEILESQEKHRKLQNMLNQKGKEYEKRVKELHEKSKEFDNFKEAQVNLNDKYKKLLVSKEKELDQAEKDSLELKERIKKLKEENKKKKTLDKKENEKKDKDIEVKTKELTKLEEHVKEKTDKIAKLEERNKTMENAAKQSDANNQKQKSELSKKVDEVTTYQINTQKLTKLNNELKHQYSQLNKVYNKAAADLKKNEKEVITKTEELAAAQKTATEERDQTEVETKALNDESTIKEEKINKLLDVLVKRGDHIRELKAQDTILNQKLKEKEDQYVDLVGRSTKNTKEKDVEIELNMKEIEKNKAAVKMKDQEISENIKTINHLKQKLASGEVQFHDNAAKLMARIQTKDEEILEGSLQHKKEMQKMILSCNEKLDTKDQQLREKALEHGRKLSEKTTEFNVKIKDKESIMLKLNAKLFEKDVVISEKDDENKKAAGRIQELNRGFEKKMEEKVITDINTQNNMRHELLLQQQNMKRALLNEQEVLKKELLSEKVSVQNHFLKERCDMELEHNRVLQNLTKRIEEKQKLLKKLKNVVLYKPSANVGLEKTREPTSSPPMLGYSWPLVHLSGAPDSVAEKTITYLVNDNLVVLLQLRRTSPLKYNLALIPNETRAFKRKFEEEDSESSGFKKRRMNPTVLMLSYSWPLVAWEPNPNSMFLLNDNGVMMLKLKIVSLKDCRLPILGNSQSSETETRNEKESSESNTSKSLLYSWPLVAYETRFDAIHLVNDIGAWMLKLRSVSLKQNHLPIFAVASRTCKRKFQEKNNACYGFKKLRLEQPVLFLTYSWPVAVYEPNPNAMYLLNDNGVIMLKLKIIPVRQNHMDLFNITDKKVSAKRKREEENVANRKKPRVEAVPSLLMLTYSWPLVTYKPSTIFAFMTEVGHELLDYRYHNKIGRDFFVEIIDTEELTVEAITKEEPQKLLMLCYSWPLVLMKPESCLIAELSPAGKFVVDSFCRFSEISFGDGRTTYKRRLSPELLEKPAKRIKLSHSTAHNWPVVPYKATKQKLDKQQERYEKVLKNISSTKGHIVGLKLSEKRKTASEVSEMERAPKKMKFQEESVGEDIPSFYSYKLASPVVKSVCLSSPGLCSPRKSVHRNGRLPKDLEELFKQNEFDTENSEEEFEESDFLTPLRKKTKCISSPGLCNTFPKVTKRSLPSSLEKLLDEENFDDCEDNTESSDEEFEEVNFSTPFRKKSKCLSSPGLCHTLPKVTKRSLPSSLEKNLLSEESLAVAYLPGENENHIFDFELRFSTPKAQKTKCLSSPGLCHDAPKVTKRVFPTSLKHVLEEELPLENDSDVDGEDDFEIRFKTPTQTMKTKCTRTPGLCEAFPQVTYRNFPPSIKVLLEKDLDNDESIDDDLIEDAQNHEYLLNDEDSYKSEDEDSDVSEDEDSFDGDSALLVDQVEAFVSVKSSSKLVPAEVVEDLLEQVVSLGEYSSKLVPAEVVEDLLEQVVF
eukprot:GFUD01027811.1.p1 GENE.GFUD01027811.1~~GFUD01027811.1.p1  ORF type:complete len:2002 (+),score=580.84 GFUD01027811.1:54-6059(+)